MGLFIFSTLRAAVKKIKKSLNLTFKTGKKKKNLLLKKKINRGTADLWRISPAATGMDIKAGTDRHLSHFC